MANILRLATISFVGRTIGKVTSYALLILVGRMLGSEALGLFAVGLVIIRVGGALSEFGCHTAVQRLIPEYRSRGDDSAVAGTIALALGIPILLGTLLVGLILALWPLLVNVTAVEFERPIWVLVLGIPLFGVILAAEGISRGFKNTFYGVLIKDFVHLGAALCFGIIAVWSSRGLLWIAIGFVASLVLGVIAALFSVYRLNGTSGIRTVRFPIKRFVTYSAKSGIASFASRILRWTDVMILTIFVLASDIGLYEAAFQTAFILTFALSAANSIFPAVASEYYTTGEIEELGDIYTTLTKWATLITGLSIIGIIFFAPVFLSIFSSEFLAATSTLIILAIGRFIVSLVGPANYLLLMTDREWIETINTTVTAIINVIFNLILIPRYGILGAAIATTTSVSLINVARGLEVWYYFQFLPYPKNIFRILVSMLIAAVGMWAIQQMQVNLILKVSIGALVGSMIFLGTGTLLWEKKDSLMIKNID